MDYTAEGYIGGFDLPVKTGKGKVDVAFVPTADYLYDDKSVPSAKARKVLLVNGVNALLVACDKPFSIPSDDVFGLVSQLLILKTSKSKVRLICDKKLIVSKICVL